MLVICIVILKSQIYRRRRKGEEIIRLNRSSRFLVYGSVEFLLFLILLILFINNAYDVYQKLNGVYISSVFQLLNIQYLESLRKYFFENSMLIELTTIVFYQKSLINTLFAIFGVFTISMFDFYIGWQRNIIYDNGILLNDKIVDWHKVTDIGGVVLKKRNYLDKVNISS